MASAALRAQLEEALRTRFSAPVAVPATRLGERPPAETLPTGITALDALCGGLPRGALSEIVGAESSGRTSLLVSVLAQARAGYAALIDAGDSFDPRGAQEAGVELDRFLWIRCSSQLAAGSGQQRMVRRQPQAASRKLYAPLEQAMRAADFLLQAGGFGLLVLDLADLPAEVARRVPLTSWFRFRRAVEHTPTVLLVLEQEPHAKTCASLVVEMKQSTVNGLRSTAAPSHTRLLGGFSVEVELLRSTQRKPARAAFTIGERRAG
jgi:hypothetical protein